MRRAVRLGTLGALALALSTSLAACALVDAGEFTEDFIEAQATMTELNSLLLEHPDVVDADYEIAAYLAGRSSVTVSLVDDASEATWVEVVEAIDDAAHTEELAGGVDVIVGTESQLSISYPADVTGAAIADETSAARAIQLRLKAPLLVELSPRSGGYHRFLRVSADHPEATITVAENFRDLDELAGRSGAETTSWMLPGLQAAGGLPPEPVMNLFRQLGTMPLTPTDAEAPPESFGVTWWDGTGMIGITTTETGHLPSRAGWPLVVASARVAAASGSSIGLWYLRLSDAEPVGGHLGARPCEGELRVREEDEALADALVASGVNVPADRLGLCEQPAS